MTNTLTISTVANGKPMNVFTREFFNEVEKRLKKYKAKHKKGEVFKTRFDNEVLVIDTKQKQKSFQFAGNIKKNRLFFPEGEKWTLSVDYHVVYSFGKTVYQTYEEAFYKEAKPIFDVVLSILNFLREQTGVDWEKHITLKADILYFEETMTRKYSKLEVKSSDFESLKVPETKTYLEMYMYSNNPLYNEIKRFFDKNAIKPVSTFELEKAPKVFLCRNRYEVQENILKQLCLFLKVQNSTQLQKMSCTVTHDRTETAPFSFFRFDLHKKTRMIYVGTVDASKF